MVRHSDRSYRDEDDNFVELFSTSQPRAVRAESANPGRPITKGRSMSELGHTWRSNTAEDGQPAAAGKSSKESPYKKTSPVGKAGQTGKGSKIGKSAAAAASTGCRQRNLATRRRAAPNLSTAQRR